MATTEMTMESARLPDVPVSDLFKRKRLDRGFDLADIARETRIPLRHLTALEAGDFSNLPALAYSIGFVRTYARYLGLDADAAARQYKQETTQLDTMLTATMPEIDAESRLPSRKVVLGSLAALGTLVAAYILYATLRPSDEEAVNAMPETVQPMESNQSAPVLSETAAPPVAETILPPAALPDPASTTASTTAPASAVPILPSANGPVMPGVPSIGLVLRATEDSWIKVSDGGPVSLKIGILKAGETYSVPQVPNLRLQTGNAGGLEVIYNGRLMPPLGNKGEVLRNKPLDPAQWQTPAP